MVVHFTSTCYHPQANGQTKSTNQILCTSLITIVEGNQMDWEQKLYRVSWAYYVAYKMTMNKTPFDMVFSLDAILPIEFLIPTFRAAQQLEWIVHELFACVDELEQLDKFSLQEIVGM